jgi:hypothetical protein
MKDLTKLESNQLLTLVTENLAAQKRISENPNNLTELATCKRNMAAIQQEIFIRYNS